MRQVFEVSRELEYFSADELRLQIGHEEDRWPLALLKELVDNALDACEAGDAPPEVAVSVDGEGFTVTDNGPGMPAATVRGALDYTKRVSDKVLYVSPTRGQLGNALKVLFAVPFVVDGAEGRVEIAAQGRRHEVTVTLDRIAGKPVVHCEEEEGFVRNGTLVRVAWPESACCLTGESPRSYNVEVMTARALLENFAAFNPHAAFALGDWRHEATEPDWTKWRTDAATSAYWYTPERLRDLLAGYLSNGGGRMTVREFVSEFRGLAGSRKQKEVVGDLAGMRLDELVNGDDLNMGAVRGLLERMQAATKAPQPRALGVIGEEHLRGWMTAQCGVRESSVVYRRRTGEDGGLPYVLEFAFGVHETAGEYRRMVTGLNWSATLDNPLAELRTLLQGSRVDAHDPVVVVAHIACPGLEYAERGKGRVVLGEALSEDLRSVVEKVTEPWRKLKAKTAREARAAHVEERDLQRYRQKQDKVTIKRATFAVMEECFMAASGDGCYIATARQVMYKARPRVLALTGGKCWDNSNYFTQRLMKDYLDEHEPSWADRVVWDARGQLIEPHTDKRVPLGGVEVMGYRGGWTSGQVEATPDEVTVSQTVPTCGPSLRYGAVVFIEKEGFAPILEDARFAERHDVAIMSTKGVSTGAACWLARAFHDAGVPVFVVRDFDLAGFKIVKTLRNGTRRAPGTPVIDLGLRLEDVEALELESEPVTYKQKKDPREYLWDCGATEEECEFLVHDDEGYYYDAGHRSSWAGERVELNAMDTPQFMGWLEAKLAEHGVTKVRPDGDTFRDAYRRAVLLQAFERKLETAKAGFYEEELPPLPDDLEARIGARLREDPKLSWDAALWEEARAAATGPDGERG